MLLCLLRKGFIGSRPNAGSAIREPKRYSIGLESCSTIRNGIECHACCFTLPQVWARQRSFANFAATIPATFDPGAGVQRMRVVVMQMPPEPDEKSFYAQLLSSVEAPVRASMNVHQMRYIVRDLLGYIGARLLIIDEVHTLLASTYRQQRILLNTLRYLANELRIPMVCAGTAEAKTALITDQQLADRFEEFELPAWQNDESFLRLIASFQTVFPLRRSSDLTSPACRRLLLDRTDGVTVRIVRLLETLAIDAVRSGKEKIDRDSLESLRVPPPLLSMGHAVEKALS